MGAFTWHEVLMAPLTNLDVFILMFLRWQVTVLEEEVVVCGFFVPLVGGPLLHLAGGLLLH